MATLYHVWPLDGATLHEYSDKVFYGLWKSWTHYIPFLWSLRLICDSTYCCEIMSDKWTHHWNRFLVTDSIRSIYIKRKEKAKYPQSPHCYLVELPVNETRFSMYASDRLHQVLVIAGGYGIFQMLACKLHCCDLFQWSFVIKYWPKDTVNKLYVTY